MICRVCNEPINFVKGSRPGKRKKASWAVHEKDLPQVMSQSQVEMVTPHPGNQRKLRQELEDSHRQGQTAAAQSAHAQAGRQAGMMHNAAASGGHNSYQSSPQGSSPQGSTQGSPQGSQGSRPQQNAGTSDEEIPGAAAVNRPLESSSGNEPQTRNAGA